MKVTLEHKEVIEAIKEYAAKELRVNKENIDVVLNTRKGKRFDADINITKDNSIPEGPIPRN